jgi:hypothetical protein
LPSDGGARSVGSVALGDTHTHTHTHTYYVHCADRYMLCKRVVVAVVGAVIVAARRSTSQVNMGDGVVMSGGKVDRPKHVLLHTPLSPCCTACARQTVFQEAGCCGLSGRTAHWLGRCSMPDDESSSEWSAQQQWPAFSPNARSFNRRLTRRMLSLPSRRSFLPHPLLAQNHPTSCILHTLTSPSAPFAPSIVALRVVSPYL